MSWQNIADALGARIVVSEDGTIKSLTGEIKLPLNLRLEYSEKDVQFSYSSTQAMMLIIGLSEDLSLAVCSGAYLMVEVWLIPPYEAQDEMPDDLFVALDEMCLAHAQFPDGAEAWKSTV